MPWSTPTLRRVRELVRGEVTTALAGASFVGNSVLRIISDANAALAHLTLRFVDWLSRQFLPDTSEEEWLSRHGNIWLHNSDGSIGRKAATLAEGSILVSGTVGITIPLGTRFEAPSSVQYETTEEVTLASEATEIEVRAIDPGIVGNMEADDAVALLYPISGVETEATIVTMNGGADEESDDELRARVLQRIQQPPMGGAADDFIAWVLQVPGVTRAWCYPLEMGIGTVTVRFMCDDLRATENDGFPLNEDVERVEKYLDTVRPVAVKDRFVVAPLRFPINLRIINLDEDDSATRSEIEESLLEMFKERAKPGQEIYKSWISEAISAATGEQHHDLIFENTQMPSRGHMPVLGSVNYG